MTTASLPAHKTATAGLPAYKMVRVSLPLAPLLSPVMFPVHAWLLAELQEWPP